jgi:biotin synthase-related radical SAM superfamily protein
MRDEVRVSIGSAGVLGLTDVRMDAAPTTAYLMLGERCAMRCAFCTQARHSHAPAQALSRITWPPFPRERVLWALAEAFSQGKIHRCCLQVTVSRQSFSQTLTLVQEITSACQVPMDASFLPQGLGQAEALFDAGLDHLGFGLDAATERVFRKMKGGDWGRVWKLIEVIARRFPGHAAAHLIVGLGESEQEALQTVQELHDLGVVVGLFAFTPVRGTLLADQPPPPLDAYRRIQVARWLIVHDVARTTDFAFNAGGRLERLDWAGWRESVVTGEAFRTSGCPDCNRPYYNERPGGVMYNYPRPLTAQEGSLALDECEFRN